MAPAPNQAISKDEVALYDRQIRLWGLDSQQRLRNAHVCVVGLKTCVALELCKNLVLAGIGQLSLYDARQVEEGDQGYLYCLGAIQDSATGQQLTTVYREYLLFLNPRVQIHCQNRDPLAIQASDFAPMHLVCLVDQPGHILSQLVQLHQTTRDSNLSSPVPSHANSAPDTIALPRGLFITGSFDRSGYVWADLGQFTFQPAPAQESDPAKSIAPQITTYTLWSDMMAKKWADYTPRQLKRAVTPLWLAILALWAYQNSSPTPEEPYVSAQVAQFHAQWLEQRGVSDAYVSFNQLWALAMQIQQQFVPISAIVGGVAAQECIKAISGKEMPLNNTFILDGTESTGILHHITL